MKTTPRSSKKEGFLARKVKPLSTADARMGCTFTDPLTLSTKKLEKELCEVASYQYCKRCMICGFGKEYVKRMDAAL